MSYISSRLFLYCFLFHLLWLVDIERTNKTNWFKYKKQRKSWAIADLTILKSLDIHCFYIAHLSLIDIYHIGGFKLEIRGMRESKSDRNHPAQYKCRTSEIPLWAAINDSVWIVKFQEKISIKTCFESKNLISLISITNKEISINYTINSQ